MAVPVDVAVVELVPLEVPVAVCVDEAESVLDALPVAVSVGARLQSPSLSPETT